MSVSCPPKSPLDQLTGLAERELGSAADPAEAESVLVARLSKVPDLRRRRGLRHPLVVVLALAACATLVPLCQADLGQVIFPKLLAEGV